MILGRKTFILMILAASSIASDFNDQTFNIHSSYKDIRPAELDSQSLYLERSKRSNLVVKRSTVVHLDLTDTHLERRQFQPNLQASNPHDARVYRRGSPARSSSPAKSSKDSNQSPQRPVSPSKEPQSVTPPKASLPSLARTGQTPQQDTNYQGKQGSGTTSDVAPSPWRRKYVHAPAGLRPVGRSKTDVSSTTQLRSQGSETKAPQHALPAKSDTDAPGPSVLRSSNVSKDDIVGRNSNTKIQQSEGRTSNTMHDIKILTVKERKELLLLNMNKGGTGPSTPERPRPKLRAPTSPEQTEVATRPGSSLIHDATRHPEGPNPKDLVGTPLGLSKIKVRGDKTNGLYERLEQAVFSGRDFEGPIFSNAPLPGIAYGKPPRPPKPLMQGKPPWQ